MQIRTEMIFCSLLSIAATIRCKLDAITLIGCQTIQVSTLCGSVGAPFALVWLRSYFINTLLSEPSVFVRIPLRQTSSF
jgi:hypothetical protein